jgi:transcriptional regulator with XRE-family HTH domain
MAAIAKARRRAGLSQAELVRRMKTTQSTVARLESGRGQPSTRTLLRFAKATGHRLNELDRVSTANYRSSFRGAPLGASPESITTMPAMAYYVYLLASKKHGTLYLGVTRDLVRRVYEHRTKAVESFTSR